MSGESVFLTGPPGAGKTYVLNAFIERAKRAGKTVAVTASTGIAATHIGGSTLHAWSGLGIKEFVTPHDLQKLSTNAKLIKRYSAADVLVIDEISMLHGKRLDMVNQVCKLLRKNDQPFGGLQVVLVGDMFQLPPVNRENGAADFAHESAAWQELGPKVCYLSEQHRQEEDDGLLTLLEAMRANEVDEEHVALLKRRFLPAPTSQPVTQLFAHNVDIDYLNNNRLQALNSQSHRFEMASRGSAAKVEQLQRSVLAPEVLILKEGAEVMFVANNPSAGFMNGTRGEVIDFKDGQPLVRMRNGRVIKVNEHSWKLEEDGKIRAEVAQLPLRLAWAITIHKSQGMSLDAAQIDLSKTFTPGMGYVALSRVRSLDGLYLTGINSMSLQMHEAIHELDRTLRTASLELAASTPEYEDIIEELPPPPSAEMNLELLETLKQWRLKRASADKVPPYVIAHDTLLEAIAANLPANEQGLLALKGMGPRKLEAYGSEMLKLIQPYAPAASQGVEAKEQGIDREKITAQYPRAFKRWQPEEESLLKELFEQGLSLDYVCAVLERQPTAIWARLHQLIYGSE